MHYRILEQDTKMYSPFGYNESNQKNFKKDVEFLLQKDLSFEDVIQICSLKWDQFKVKLRTYGFIVEESTTPFKSIDTDDWSFDDDDDVYDLWADEF